MSEDVGQGVRAPLVHLNDALGSALAQGAVLTPTRRLAREVAYAADFAAIRADHRAWSAPDALSLDAFLVRCYHEAQDAGVAGAEATLLPDDIAPLAMMRAAPEAEWRHHVEAFAEAWRTARLHGIRSADPGLEATENGRVYSRWAQGFEALAKKEGWITTAELPDRLVRMLDGAGRWRPRPAAVFALDDAPPAIRRFLVAVRYPEIPLGSAPPAATTRLLALRQEKDELALAALWARERLAADPNTRIGIVVAQLGPGFPAAQRRLHALFADRKEPAAYVNVSGGIVLADEPVCRDALALLLFTVEGIDHEAQRLLAQSPFIRPAVGTDLGGQGSRLSRFSAQLARSQDAREPASRMRRLLRWAGWPGQALSSRELQAQRQFEDCLDAFAFAERVIGGQDWPGAVANLLRLAGRRLFAPHSTHAPIQVLGRAESIGLTFDHLWLAGLSRSGWPPVPEPNPLLPLRLQRMAGVAPLSLDDELYQARATTKRWRHSACHVLASYAGEDEEPTPLLGQQGGFAPVAASDVVQRPALAANGHPWAVRRNEIALEEYVDEQAGALVCDSPSGDASLLRDQSLCPFRAWARHRLNLQEARPPSPFPDAAERGTVAHEVLAELMRRFPSHDEIAGIAEDDIRAIIDGVLDRLFWPKPYRRRETTRLQALAAEWLARERQRAPFKVVSVEEEVEAEIGGLRLALRIDRIDDVAQGGRLLIDYKTGRVSVNAWRGSRPEDPQLPLYAFALTRQARRRQDERAPLSTPAKPVHGIAFAKVRPGEARLVGVVDPTAVAGDFTTAEQYADKTFADLRADWEATLAALAKQFLDGCAAVDPVAPHACRRCHLHPLCRIFNDR